MMTTLAPPPTKPSSWPGGIDKYLVDNNVVCDFVTPFEEGRSCYIWRLDGFPGTTEPVVLKYADSTAKASGYPVSPDRLSNEIYALRSPIVASASTAEPSVRVPRVLRNTQNGFIMSWAGEDTLTNAIRSGAAIDMASIGSRIGKWVGCLHMAGMAAKPLGLPTMNPELERVFFSPDGLMEKYVKLAITDPKESEQILDTLRTTQTAITLTPWDFRPMNTILHTQGHTTDIHIVDWELTHNGEAAWDVATWSVEAWVLEDKYGDRGMLDSFLTAYKQHVVGVVDDQFRYKLAMVVGVMLLHFMRIAQKLWGCSEEEVASWTKTAAEYLRAGANGKMSMLARGRLKVIMA